MNVSNKRFLIFGSLLCIAGTWSGVLLFRGTSIVTSEKSEADKLELVSLRQQLSEKEREILELKRMLVAEGEARSPKIQSGSGSLNTPLTLPSVSEKGQVLQVGQFQIEQQGARAIVKDASGKPMVVFDAEHRSVIAPNGMYIPNEGRLVITDRPPEETKSEHAEKPVKVGFKNESSSRLDLAWVNYDGKLVFYKTLQPGQSYEQKTFETHPWVALNSSGKILDLIKPTKEDENTQYIFAPAKGQKEVSPGQ